MQGVHWRALDRAAAVLAIAIITAPALLADEARTERLEKLARVWAAAKYAHPAMLARNVDWDGALVRAIPRVRDAATSAELAAAIDSMLDELHDPATHVIARLAKQQSPAPPLIRREGDVLVLSIGAAAGDGYAALFPRTAEMAREIASSPRVVVDLRTNDPDAADLVSSFVDSAPLWTATATAAVPYWTPFYSGWAASDSWSGGYYSGLMLRTGTALQPAKKAPRRLVFVTDGTPLPGGVVALWRAGNAAIVSTTAITSAETVKRIPIDDDHEALIRGSEFAIDVRADLVTPSPLEAAIRLAASATPTRRHASPLRSLPSVHPLVEREYRTMVAPDLTYRLLAAFRIWSTIDSFYPYKNLIGDWDAVLREFIPRFEEAEGAEAYVGAVLEMTAHIEDSHTGAWDHPSLDKVLPTALVPFRIDNIEGQPAVIEKYDPATPVSLGDIIVSVDGEPFDARVKRLWKFVAGATEAGRRARVMNAALRGPVKSTAHIVLRDASGQTRTVDIPRMTDPPQPQSVAVPYRVLDGNIGYADLRQLTVPQVDAMFDALMKTKAIVFDMRGYPKGTAWSIAPRINTRHATVGAIFRRPQISGTSAEEETSPGYTFEQSLPKSDKPLYTGKVVVLIDDRAVSQSEHSCLFFEQAAGATFIGTPTAGTNGDVTSFRLPGGFIVYFTGHDVRHADGRQLQRIGIIPNIRVEPTLAGLRSGRDEVLDRAIEYINRQSL